MTCLCLSSVTQQSHLLPSICSTTPCHAAGSTVISLCFNKPDKGQGKFIFASSLLVHPVCHFECVRWIHVQLLTQQILLLQAPPSGASDDPAESSTLSIMHLPKCTPGHEQWDNVHKVEHRNGSDAAGPCTPPPPLTRYIIFTPPMSTLLAMMLAA